MFVPRIHDRNSPIQLKILARLRRIDRRDTVTDDDDRQLVADRQPYPHHRGCLAQDLADTLINHLALHRSRLTGLLVESTISHYPCWGIYRPALFRIQLGAGYLWASTHMS